MSIVRLAFPLVKQFIFPCGVVRWSSETKFPFFNGEGIYDSSYCLYSGPSTDRIRKSFRVQKEYADCFTTAEPEPMVRTQRANVHANRFPGAGRTIWTLYNARYTTVRGPVLTVPHRLGAVYRDVWKDEPIKPEITGDRATISLTLTPQGLGCIVQE